MNYRHTISGKATSRTLIARITVSVKLAKLYIFVPKVKTLSSSVFSPLIVVYKSIYMANSLSKLFR